jgi:hypothetical protein
MAQSPSDPLLRAAGKGGFLGPPLIVWSAGRGVAPPEEPASS